ncbi:MAG: deaminase, partial [Ktedonobacteraceae bacterium]|nr:deaminase [Ktedonobacteraceae bacterium]
MGKVSTGFSMSLDGFVAGPHDEVDQVFKWLMSGDTNITVPKGDDKIELNVPSESADILQGASTQTGALVAGRRLFELTHGWGGKHPLDVPI